MESRVYNVQVLRHDDDQAIRKLSASIVCDLHFRALFAEHGVNPFEAVLADDDRLPGAFRERRHPQMLLALEARRLRKD